MNAENPSTDRPALSVIVATYNRAPMLRTAIEHLVAQQGIDPDQFEIVICDNHSTDATKQTIEDAARTSPVKIVYCFEEQAGKVHALNRALSLARGEIIAFTDDDCAIDPQWVARIVEAFRATGCDALGGRILPAFQPGVQYPPWIVKCHDLLTGPIVAHDFGKETKPYGEGMLKFVGANMAVSASMLARIQGFSKTYVFNAKDKYPSRAEDTDLFRRIRDAGGKIVYCGAALVHHPVEPDRSTLKYITRWQIAHGRNYAKNADQYAKIFGVPRWVYPRIAAGFLRTLFSFGTRRRLHAYLGLLREVGVYSGYKEISKRS